MYNRRIPQREKMANTNELVGQSRYGLQLSFSDQPLTERWSLKCFRNSHKNCDLSFVKRVSLFWNVKSSIKPALFSFVNTLLSQNTNWLLFSELDFCHSVFKRLADFFHQTETCKTDRERFYSCCQGFCGAWYIFTLIPFKCGFRIRLARNFAQLLKGSRRFSVC